MNGMRTLSMRRSVMWRNYCDLWFCSLVVLGVALDWPMWSNPWNCDWGTDVRENSTFWSTEPNCVPFYCCFFICCFSIETNPKVFQFNYCILLSFSTLFIVLSLQYLSTHHHQFSFSISQLGLSISKLHSTRTTHARLTLCWILLFEHFCCLFEFLQSARITNRLCRLLESNWNDAVTVHETYPKETRSQQHSHKQRDRHTHRVTVTATAKLTHTCATEWVVQRR